MAYIAQKVTNLSGRDFLIGEIIPEECIIPERVPALIKMGIIAESADEIPAAEWQVTFQIDCKSSDGPVILELTAEELSQCFSVLMGSAEDAKKNIAEITNCNVLLLLDASEHRKTVSKILEDRINELSQQEA